MLTPMNRGELGARNLNLLLQAKLNVQSFDTGFPVDFGRLRRELGPGVQILGGPSVMRLQAGPPAAPVRSIAVNWAY